MNRNSTRDPLSTLPHRRLATACVQLGLTVVLVFGLLVSATVVSIGIANAEDLGALVRPDTGVMIGLMVVAIAAMCALSAAAVHFGNRSRDR